jgi:hypothetical protein
MQQAMTKMAWIRDTMPMLYPQVTKDPLAQMAITRSVMQFSVPAKTPDEDIILTPDSLGADNFAVIERNPLYARKSYAEQQQLKGVWYAKTSVLDPSFKAMSFDQQQQFYTSLMRRGPAMSTGILPGYSPQEVQKSFDASSRAIQTAKVIGVNLFTSFAESLTDIITGPARLIAGDSSLIARIMDDVEKNREWYNTVSESNDFFTKTLPSLVGVAGGFAVGPWGKISKVMTGGFELAKGAGAVEKMMGTVPGLLEKAGTAIGAKAPSLLYQTAGGAAAGAAQGITMNLSQGRPWSENLGANIGMGVGFEFATRYLGMFATVRKAAKEMGIDPKQASSMFREPFTVGSSNPLGAELEKAMKQNPVYREAIFGMTNADKDGILAKNLYTPEGVKMRAEILGFTVKDEPGTIQILKDDKVVQTFTHGDPSVRIDKAHYWLDSQSNAAIESWLKTTPTKQFSESVMTAPGIVARQVTFIPDSARNYIADFMNSHGIAGWDFRLDPNRQAISQIDDLFEVLRSHKSGPKLMAALKARGISFDANPKVNLGTIKELQGKLDQILPEGSYLIVDRTNAENSRLSIPGQKPDPNYKVDINIPHKDIPVVYLEAPDKYEPSVNNKLFVGSGSQIRTQFAAESKYKKGMDTQLKKKAKGMGLSYKKFMDTQVVELQIPMMDEAGNQAFVRLHSPSMKDAVELLSRGRIGSGKDFSGHFFADNPLLKKQYDDYLKRIRKTKGQEWVDKNWMPFQYVAAQAKQNDFYLGVYRGKYLLQDVLDPAPGAKQFDNLSSVVEYLNSNESRTGRPSIDGLSTDAVKEIYPNIENALHDLPEESYTTRKKFGLYDAIETKLAPSTWMLDRFSQLKVVQDTGLSPTAMGNQLNDAVSAVRSFINPRDRWRANLMKGVSADESKMLKRWLEALDTPNELGTIQMDDVMYEVKSDIEREMGTTFGAQRADQLLSIGTQARRYFNELFSFSGMDYNMFLKHYFPHIRSETAKYGGGVSNHLANKLFKGIPANDRKMFFEFMREVDPKDVAFSDSLDDVLKIYTHMMARKLYIRPITTMIKDQIRDINKVYNLTGKTPKDYIAFEHYIASMFESIEGIAGPSERTFRIATDNMMEELSNKMQALTGQKLEGATKGKFSMMSKLASITIGGQLAGRPYPIMRNLMQSLVPGGTTIQLKWWFKGLDEVLRPGSLQRAESLGLFTATDIPVTTGHDIAGAGKLGAAVTKVMKPYSWSDNVNRAIIYFGMEARAKDALLRLSQGKIKASEFARESGANLFGKAETNYALGLLNKGKGVDAFVHQVSKLASDRTQVLYDAFNQPSIFRGSFGRLMGQYTSWPINMLHLVKDRLSSDSLTFGQKAAFFAELGITTGAIAAGVNSVGLSPRQWAPWNMMLFQGGPYYQMVNDAFGFLNGSQEGLKGLANAMTSLIPFALEGEGVMRAWQAMQDGDPQEAIIHLLSAPIRTDIYPRRKVLSDVVANEIIQLGQKYLKAQGFMK